MSEAFKERLSSDIEAVNSALKSCPYLRCEQEKVIQAENYALSAGGKRIRPVLCTEFYRLFGGTQDISDIAICLEMIHTFSLIHDDMPEMDNDDLRRGKPSCHIAYGTDIALLAGDGLSLLPFEIISDKAKSGKISYETAVRLMSELSGAVGHRGMIMGQELDLCSEDISVDADFLTRMSSLKTGCLLKASCKFGAILAGCGDKEINAAETYAENLGLAFQIVDDILDVVGDEKLLGKPIGSDKERNKNTFADIMGIEKAEKLACEYTAAAVEAIKDYEGSQFLCELANSLLTRKK
jgi:polyprenyl synthetase